MSSPVRLSSVTFVRPTQAIEKRRLKFSAMLLRRLVPRQPTDIQVKFYGDRLGGTPPSGE